MYVVLVSRRMQTVTNFYIANLALSDVVLALFCIPFQFRAALIQRWDLPEFMCQFCPFIQTLSVSSCSSRVLVVTSSNQVNVSVWTLVAICIDRYQAIIKPLAKKQSKKTARLVILLIWVAGGLTALPMGAAHTFQEVLDFDNGGLKPFCSVRWASTEDDEMREDDSGYFLLIMFQVYFVIILLLEYLAPLSIITLAYLKMGMKLWWTITPGQADQLRDDKILRNKKKVSREEETEEDSSNLVIWCQVLHMMLIVVVVFSLCWAPWQSYSLTSIVYPAVNQWRYVNIMFFIFHWLAMSNSCYNPFIYGIYSVSWDQI